MSSPFVRWLIPLGCIPPLSEWRVKVLYFEMLQTRMEAILVVSGASFVACRRELAETVAALQQRRLLTEAKEYTLSIKVLGQLGPQPK